MPPESSTLARPAISRIQSAASSGVRLSSSRGGAPKSRPGASADGGDDVAIGAEVAILLEDVELIDAAAKLVDFPEQAYAGESEGFAGEKPSGGHAGFGDAGDAGDIAGADIFFEREADDFGHYDILSSWAS